VNPAEGRWREVLRQASVALQGRVVTMWEVTPANLLQPVLSSGSPHPEPRLDVSSTLRQWGASMSPGGRWVGCRLDEHGRWCIAPVRKRPPAPPPGGVERRSRERITLELAGLCLGLTEDMLESRRLPEPDAMAELARKPSVIAHEVANPLTAALAGLDQCLEHVRGADQLEHTFRAELLEELAGVAEGMEQAIEFLRSIQDRGRGAFGRVERFDAAQVVRSCVVLERPMGRKHGVALRDSIQASGVFLQGEANALYQILTNLIRNAITASQGRPAPVIITLQRGDQDLRLTVEDHGVGIPPENLPKIFDSGFTTQEFGAGSGTGLPVVRQLTEEMFGGRVEVVSTPGQGSVFTVALPIPPQRTPENNH
jgi:signal transduction histidine kinase